MHKEKSYLTGSQNNRVHSIVRNIDKDVEQGEDILMLGLGLVMMSTLLAPIAPPTVVLPFVAVTLAVSASVATIHYHEMARKLSLALAQIDYRERALLHPITAVFAEHPPEQLNNSLNPLKNLKRTLKSALGGLLINPLWMPIFYMMGMQIGAEKKLGLLNLAIIGIEQKITSTLPELD